MSDYIFQYSPYEGHAPDTWKNHRNENVRCCIVVDTNIFMHLLDQFTTFYAAVKRSDLKITRINSDFLQIFSYSLQDLLTWNV